MIGMVKRTVKSIERKNNTIMTSKEIYSKTKKFPVRLFLLNMACAVGALILFAVFMVISLLTTSGGLAIGGAVISLFVYAFAKGIVQHYIGYMFKYGAVHAIAMAKLNGSVSDSYFNDSVEYIKNGFLKANAYLVVDKLIHAAVRGVTRLANFILGFLPDNLKNMIDTFLGIYLDYIDECCLAYAMLHPNENVAKSSCDGVVLYYQDAKGLLKPAAMTVLRVTITNFVIAIIGLIFIVFPPVSMIVWLLLYSIVTPFLEHRILCNTICPYLDYAMTNEVRTDVYAKLQNCRPFQKLVSRMEDPMFDPAPGNEGFDANTMRAAVKNTKTEYNGDQYEYEQQSAESDSLSSQTNVGQVSTVNQKAKPRTVEVPNPIPIPEPPKREPTQEQVLWQKAWERMSAEQKRTYNAMDETRRKAWKVQILKALFNYDLK